VLLWGPTQGDATYKDIKWSNSVEPKDGIWTWEDMSSLRFRFGRTDPGAPDTSGTIYIYEVWAIVHYREPQVHVNPKSQVAQPLTVTINATDIDELYGFEFKLYYNARVLTATSVSLGPYLNTTAGGTANTFGHVVEIDDTLGLVWVTQGIIGDRNGGYLNKTKGEWGVLATIYFSKDADGNSNFDLESKIAGFNPVPVSFRYGETVKKAYPIAHTVVQPVHDVAITNMVPDVTGVHQGENVTFDVTVLNKGDYKETFDITIYAEDTPVATETVTDLDVGVPQVVPVTWNTSGASGKYILTAVADTLGPPTESETDDNTYTPPDVILRPDGNGLCTAWTGDFTDWDDVTPDNDTTYVSATSDNLNETSTLEDCSNPPGSIDTLELTIVASQTTGDEQIRLMLGIGGTGYHGSLVTPSTTSYETYSYTWTTNPATGSAWTWSDVNALQAGVRSVQNGMFWLGEVKVTQLFVTVTTRFWVGPDVEVSNVVPNATAIYAGDVVEINVTVTNKGPKPITFDLNTFGVHGWENLAETRESDDAWTVASADGASAKWMAFGGTEAFNTTGWTGVDTVEVGIERQIDKGTDNIIISISNDSATSWSAITYTEAVSETTDKMVWINVTTAYTWDVSMVNNTAVKLTYEAVGTLGIIKVDYLAIRVTPQAPLTPVEKFPTVGKKVSEEDDVAHTVGTQEVTALAPGVSVIKTYNWDTTGRANSTYIIRANTSEIDKEIERANNKFETPTDRKVYIGPDVVIISMAHNTTVVDAGAIVQINATVKNRGKLDATFDVQAWANTTSVGTLPVVDLASNANQTLTFNWDTTSATNGTYPIWANATILVGEFRANDNTRVSGEVYIGPDVAVTDIVPSPTVVDAGTAVSIDVTVENEGASAITFDVKAYANRTSTGTVTQVDTTKQATGLAPGATQELAFSWDTTSFANDTYVIFASATILNGETRTADNTMIDGSVYIGPDVAVTGVEPNATSAYLGDTISIDVTVKNEGASTVTFDVKAYTNQTSIANVTQVDITKQAAALAASASQILTFSWDTASFVENDTYTVFANATILNGETDTADNTYVDGTVYIGPDVAVSGIAYISKTTVFQGETITVRAKVLNLGTQTETFAVKLYANFTSEANLTLIETWNATDLPPGIGKSHTFTWNTNGFTSGDYDVKVEATQLLGETNTADNTAQVAVRVKLLGDIDDNGVVDAHDLYILSRAFDSQEAYRSTPRSSNWNAEADLNGDNFLTTDELITLINNYSNTG